MKKLHWGRYWDKKRILAGIGEIAREDGKGLLVAFALASIMLQTVYRMESIFTVLKAAASFFWLFIIPGMSLVSHWRGSLGFIERFVIGSIAGLGAVGALAYGLGFTGFPVVYEGIVLPLLLIAIGLWGHSQSEENAKESVKKV